MSTERERFEDISKKIKRERDVFPHHHHHPAAGGGRRVQTAAGGGTLNTITPCAACKLLRRRCSHECPFSPYFSPHEPHKFASVHKVFGASNVSKMLMEVPENQRADAANSLVYEANVRLQDPVYGCMGTISALQQQIQFLQAELNAVRAEILKYKFAQQQTEMSTSPHICTLLSSGVVSIAMSPPPVPPPPPPLLIGSGLPIDCMSGEHDFSVDISTGNNNSNSNSNNNNMTYFG